MARRGVPVRFVVWLFHLALPLLGLWLLLAVPATDLLVEHHPGHFWLVALVAPCHPPWADPRPPRKTQ